MTPALADRPTSSRILVVEDEALIAEEIHDRLTRMNCDVVGIADTGARALAAVGDKHPDLVLMDIRLKGEMDGIEAADAIRRRWNVPVVYLTAHSDQATLQRAKQTAPLGYVIKPFQERELMVAIEMALHRHGLERQLRESELRYAATLASIGEGVLATDPAGRITYMNPVAEDLTRWRSADAQNQTADSVLVLIDEATRSKIVSSVSAALSTGETVRSAQPVLLVPKEGDPVPVDDSAAPIRDDAGLVAGAVVALRDIRHKRLAEEALRRAEEQLRQAQKMESIGQLAGGVAHDFNNFLTVINGCGEHLLHRGNLSERDADLVREILKAAERSAGLTRQLLAFGRRQVLKAEILDLNALVQGTGQMLSRLIGEHVRICVDCCAELAAVRADPGQLEQVIMNLAVNARDAMPNGGTLTITTTLEKLNGPRRDYETDMAAGRYAVLTVTDTGTGMDEATRSRVFEPFFTTKGLGKGTGLGLATVYGIVRQTGGHIYVESKAGVGTTFRTYLPAIEHEKLTAPASKPAATAHRGGETILLVEDDEAVRAIAASGLKSHGYAVIEVEDGASALIAFHKHGDAIDILVTDTVMPGMSGPQIAEQLLQQRPQLPVLLLSGYSSDAVAHSPIMDRAAFLQKPFTPTVLAQKVREVLDHPRKGKR